MIDPRESLLLEFIDWLGAHEWYLDEIYIDPNTALMAVDEFLTDSVKIENFGSSGFTSSKY
jgi:hypothetical protein